MRARHILSLSAWLCIVAPALLGTALLGTALLATPLPVSAQRASPTMPTVQPDAPASRTGATVAQQASDGIGIDFLASAVLPGAAQFRAGDERWVPYAATEAWAWVSWLQERRAARSAERSYRDLAWQVARRVSVGERRDSVFEYYEAMASTAYAASGTFDVEPNVPGIQPEPQLNTFNGRVWQLARDLHFAGPSAPPGTPQYEAALEYYQRHAIPATYAWAWGASNLEQQVFANLIAESDAAYRSATRYLGVILANHVASTVDALVTARLRQLGAGSARFESGPTRGSMGTRWEYGLEVRF